MIAHIAENKPKFIPINLSLTFETQREFDFFKAFIMRTRFDDAVKIAKEYYPKGYNSNTEYTEDEVRDIIMSISKEFK